MLLQIRRVNLRIWWMKQLMKYFYLFSLIILNVYVIHHYGHSSGVPAEMETSFNAPTSKSIEDSLLPTTTSPSKITGATITRPKSSYLGPRKQIIVVSYLRSGSTFIGDLIKSTPDVFYSFEPLHSFGLGSRMESPIHMEQSIDLIKSLLKCNFSSHYLKQISKRNSPFINHNTQVSKFCKGKSVLCQQPDFYSSLCQRFGTHLIKTVRLPMNATRQLIDKSTRRKLKIIYLVRDPRGIMASRRTRKWCVNPNCRSPVNLCRQIDNDLEAYTLLKKTFPEAFYKVQFEEMANNVITEVEKMFKFLGLKVTPVVKNYISSHTGAKNKWAWKYPHSTFRDSKAVATAWRKSLDQATLSFIEKNCSTVLKQLNHKSR